MISIVALWILVLVETGLLLLLLRVLGKLRQQGLLTPSTQSEGLKVGEQAPLFTAFDYDGKSTRLEDLQGRRRMLVFVAPGCPACSLAIEMLNTFLSSNKDITVLVLGDSDPQLNRLYAGEQGAQMDILAPESEKLKDTYDIPVIPFAYLLDEEGTIRARGFFTYREHLQSLLNDAFPEPLIVS